MLTEVMHRSRHVRPVQHCGSVKQTVSKRTYSQIHVTYSVVKYQAATIYNIGLLHSAVVVNDC